MGEPIAWHIINEAGDIVGTVPPAVAWPRAFKTITRRRAAILQAIHTTGLSP
jgi:hypothetical protein